MKKLGVTGGIGSGKSLFCSYLENLGAFVLDADNLAKEIMTFDESVKAQIIDTFGKESYLSDGNLNKPFLSKEAFSAGRNEELNAIVHPSVYRFTQNIAKKAELEGYPLFVKEAALLLQNGRPDNIDYVVWLDAPEKVRVQRAAYRDNVSEDEIRVRLSKQKSYKEVQDFIDEVIVNDGNDIDLMQIANELFGRLTSKR